MEGSDRLSTARVLVVEDDSALRNVVRFNLQQAGYEVITASDPCDALSKLRQQPVGLILTDMTMPRMSGIEFCRQIRANPEFVQLPVMMLTAKAFEVDAETLREELGIVEIIFKPFSPKMLVHAVAQHLREAAGEMS